MTRVSLLIAIASIGFSILPLGGCAERSGTEGSASSTTQALGGSATATPSANGPPHRVRSRAFGGVVGLYFRAADSLDLTEAQRDAVALLEPGLASAAEERAARDALRSDLAAGARAGAIDSTKLAADEQAIAAAAIASKGARASALRHLHDVLNVAQRKAVADQVSARLAEREARSPSPPTGDAGTPWAKRRMDRLSTELDLDAAQQAELTTLLARVDRRDAGAPHGARPTGADRMQALAAAFATDTFDAAAMDAQGDAGKGPPRDGGVDREVELVAGLLSIVRPDQREKLAATIERWHPMMWRDSYPNPFGDDWNDAP